MFGFSFLVSSEVDCDLQETINIEKQTTGGSFETIGKVIAKGNSSEMISYHFKDIDPTIGINYYRLKIMDFDNEYEYSDIKSVKWIDRNNHSIRIYPNPFKNDLQLEWENKEQGNIWIKDVFGNVLKQQKQMDSGEHLNLQNLPSGIYILELEIGNSSYFEKIVKK